ncbi:SDR family oxidoreductase [Ralstonia sp. UBA689]|uniref:SDR family oxidoreductase n=1 Tax=Ralstonia sp. UBA689 TaxID=1947373 RepID=UPI0025FC09EE|nr:SDR family oxidoreductase [Ralstonia sp. UBA689]
MRILVCGANGFIGAALCERLVRDWHLVLRGVRQPRGPMDVAIDYTTDLTPGQWLPRLRDVDVVINAVGIIVERGAQTFEKLHYQAPAALFRACQEAGVQHVVQISALGADSGDTAYFQSKYRADLALLAQPMRVHVVRPALVYGPAGTSARMFRALASIPMHGLPSGGQQRLRPVHIDDLVDMVAGLLSPGMELPGPCINAVGATETTYREMLSHYRAAMQLPPALAISIPSALMRMAVAVGDRIPGSPLTRDTWRMLQDGSTGSDTSTRSRLRRHPLGVEAFISKEEASALRHEALSTWQLPLLRLALAIVWICTAWVSVFGYPRADSLALLSRLGLHGLTADAALIGASALDLMFGMATLLWPSRRLWLAQLVLVLTYSLLICVALPEFLIHPFGPVLKNIPFLAVLITLFSSEVKS